MIYILYAWSRGSTERQERWLGGGSRVLSGTLGKCATCPNGFRGLYCAALDDIRTQQQHRQCGCMVVRVGAAEMGMWAKGENDIVNSTHIPECTTEEGQILILTHQGCCSKHPVRDALKAPRIITATHNATRAGLSHLLVIEFLYICSSRTQEL